MRRLRVVAIVMLSALASALALLTPNVTSPAPASSATVPKISAASAVVTLATTPEVTSSRAVAALINVPAMRQVAAASDSAAISIVEPPFKPPTTWRYEPATLTVKVGATVTWTNSGAVAHTATADDGKTFDSGVMRPKATFSITLKSAGTFAYHCTYHRWMKGTIIAVP